MGVAIAVTQDTFEADVLTRSRSEVVLVDFFAEWCGPCKMLKPVLERLAQEYNFTLAKIDIDANPNLAQTYGVEGVPDVRVALDGALQTGFVGMLPEPEIRQFLAQFELHSTVETQLAMARTQQQAGDLKAAGQIYQGLLRDHPTSPEVAIATGIYLIQTQQFALAEKLLGQLASAPPPFDAKVKALQSLLALRQAIAGIAIATAGDAQYVQAIKAILAQQYEPAFTTLIQLIRTQAGVDRDRARQALLIGFGLLGNDHALTATYRRQLSQALY